MTPRDLLSAMCALRPDWLAERDAILGDELFYPAIADLGRPVFAAQLAGEDAKWIDAFYAIVERAMRDGDPDTQNLVVVGLFESLQGQSYHDGAPDLVERRLGATSRRAWEELMQGWTGGDVRTVEAWRRVIRNGIVTRVAWHDHGVVDWTGTVPQLERDGRTVPLDPARAKSLRDALAPWMATAVLAPRAIPGRWDETLTIDSGRDRAMFSASGDALFDGKRWFAASIAALPWPVA